MDEQNRPKARKVKVVGTGKEVEKKGEGLGTGPVGNSGLPNQGAPAGQSTQQQAQRPQQTSAGSTQRPVQTPFGNTQRPTAGSGQSSQQSPFGNIQRPVSGNGTQQRPAGAFPFGSTQRPSQTGNSSSARPQQSASGSAQRPQQAQQPFAARPSSVSSQSQNSSGTQRAAGGGNSKLLLIIVAIVAIFLIYRLATGGCSTGNLTGDGLYSGESGGNGTDIGSLLGGDTGNESDIGSLLGSDTGNGSGIASLLSTFLGGSTNNAAYDFSGGNLLSSITGGSAQDQYFTSSSQENTAQVDTTVAAGARSKFTTIKGGQKDTVTILVYMCGTDLESQSGMATADIKEMLNSKVGKNVNLLIYTGGCSRWKNNVISNQVNQIYLIKDGNLTCLEKDMGNGNMTDTKTLQSFIEYGYRNYKANRMCLIFWDHGGGSVSGYGYDEKYGRGKTMTLAGINTVLKNCGIKFDFIGFDACLMATVENGLMLSQYADYMIASEESEPGVGWYYTNWLNKLTENPSMPTVQIGKNIADDFVEVCAKQCRGQATTLSVVDLAELQATVPEELKTFSIEASEMIKGKKYKTVATARSKTREFAQSAKIDQIDLVHFAKNMNTTESKELADALQGAVKYNRTGGGISNAYGLSIYFPYKKASNVKNAVSTYQVIGMDEEYTRCIQAFASLEASGQVSATGSDYSSYFGGGSSQSAFPGLMDSLMGGGTSSSSGYYGDDLTGMLSSLLGGGGSGGSSILDLFGGRDITSGEAAEYVTENHIDNSLLVWQGDTITLPEEQLDIVTTITENMYIDDGDGYLVLGRDNKDFETGKNTVKAVFEDGLNWVHFGDQPVAYYYLDEVWSGDDYAVTGYVPAMIGNLRVNLFVCFDSEHDGEGVLTGAKIVYGGETPDTEAKTLIDLPDGTEIWFLCDHYDYSGKYDDSYKINAAPFVLRNDTQIANRYITTKGKVIVNFCLTDIYEVEHWTQALSLQ